ncbi:MAG: dTMP kinase [Elusimicrobiales bacterium]|nr:dTMP kinase [Elusimicrobiales bacterium]
MKKDGVFIVFEGADKTGKTTQAELLKRYLEKKGIKVILTREPGGTQVSEKIREIVLDPQNVMSPLCELFLYEAARADHVENLIKPAIEKGYVVISDRFTLASIVYQGYGRRLGEKLVKKLNRVVTKGLNIDIVFGFDINEDEYFRRSRKFLKDRIEKEDKNFMRNIIFTYKKLFKKIKGIKIIDSSKSIDEIHQFIVNEVEKKLK